MPTGGGRNGKTLRSVNEVGIVHMRRVNTWDSPEQRRGITRVGIARNGIAKQGIWRRGGALTNDAEIA